METPDPFHRLGARQTHNQVDLAIEVKFGRKFELGRFNGHQEDFLDSDGRLFSTASPGGASRFDIGKTAGIISENPSEKPKAFRLDFLAPLHWEFEFNEEPPGSKTLGVQCARKFLRACAKKLRAKSPAPRNKKIPAWPSWTRLFFWCAEKNCDTHETSMRLLRRGVTFEKVTHRNTTNSLLMRRP